MLASSIRTDSRRETHEEKGQCIELRAVHFMLASSIRTDSRRETHEEKGQCIELSSRRAQVSKIRGLHGQSAQRSPTTTKGSKKWQKWKPKASRLRLAKTDVRSNPRPTPLTRISRATGAHWHNKRIHQNEQTRSSARFWGLVVAARTSFADTASDLTSRTSSARAAASSSSWRCEREAA